MTDKERIEIYVKKLPRICNECPLSELECVDYYNDCYICKLIGSQVKDKNYCPLKTIQSVQNEKAVECLEKVKKEVWFPSDYKESILEEIDQLIAELKGEKNE